LGALHRTDVARGVLVVASKLTVSQVLDERLRARGT